MDVYVEQGFGRRLGLGRVPALVLVDFTVGFANPRLFGGGNIPEAIARSAQLLAFFRARCWPVAHTRIVYAKDGSDVGVFARKVPSLARLTEDEPSSHTVPSLAPQQGELVVRKTEASAFFGTGLAAWMIGRRVDTVVVAGCTTSGCVRATVVDAASHNFIPCVVRDCVGDRALGPHEASLFDMRQKYADVMDLRELLGELETR